jgi:galactokinase
MSKDEIKSHFEAKFQTQATGVVRAPGRINLIGEHTDYNDGFVMPAAIDKAIFFAYSSRADRNFVVHALDLGESITFSLDSLQKTPQSWANYLIGVVAEIVKTKSISNGLNIVFSGDIPLGAGLSSSAAVESGMVFLLNEEFDLSLTKFEMAKIAQFSEHNFAGVNCGIMDMFASIFGKENAIIQLDCRDLSFQYFDLKQPNHTILLCNTNVKHNLVDSEYNVRRAECEEGVAIIQQKYPDIKSLRDVSMAMLLEYQEVLRPVVFRRCKYVVGEEQRVRKASESLVNNDIVAFGKAMFETHDGLSKDYEVSCIELDFLADEAQQNPAVVGARMMGGGFGGCTINLIENAAIESFKTEISSKFNTKFGHEPLFYAVKLCDGVGLV